MKIEIRNVRKDDLDTFVNLYRISYRGLEDYAYTKNRDIKYYFRWLMNRDRNGFFIAEVDEPLGIVACDTNWISFFDNTEVGEIHELFVHPGWRRKGVGRKLLSTAIEHAKNKNRFLIELWVGKTNELAKRFYQKNGFVEEGSWGKWIRMIKRFEKDRVKI